MKKEKTKFIVYDCNHGTNLYGICDNKFNNFLSICDEVTMLVFTQKKDAQKVCNALNKCKGLITLLCQHDKIIKEAENGDKVIIRDVV